MKTFKKLLAALFCIALLGPVMTSCSKNSTAVTFTDNATQETALGYYSQFEAAGFTKEMKKEGEITTYTFTKVISGKTYQFIGNWQENKKTRGTFTLMFSEL